MFRLLLVCGVLCFSAVTVKAADMVSVDAMPAGVYTLDRSHAALLWKVKHSGLSNYIGRFTDYTVDLDFKPDAIEESTLKVSVNPLSLATDYPYPEKKDFSKQLATDEKWLNGGNFPRIEFVSTAVRKTGETTGVVDGELTFLGVTKPLSLDVVFNGAYLDKPFAGVPALGFSATALMTRSDWGLDTYVPSIGDEVEFEIEVELHKEEAAE